MAEQFVGDAGGNFGSVAPAQYILVGDQNAARLLDGGGDRFPVIGREGSEVNHFDRSPNFVGGSQGLFDHGTVSDHGELIAGPGYFCFAEGDHELRPGMGGTVVGFAVKFFVFEEKDGIVAADGGAQKANRIKGIRREDYAKAGDMGEGDFPALAVIDGATGEVAADRHPDHGRASEAIIGPPAQHRQLVAQLHHGGPDVVEKLDLGDGFHATGSHADGPPDDAGFSDGCIKDAIGAELALKALGSLKNAAFALNFG